VAPANNKRLAVAVTDERGGRVRAPGLAAWLTRVAPAAAHGGVAIALVSDARIRALNRQYRHQDKTTDVLSFPAHPPHLGDIAIAAGVARRQARDARHSYGTELRVLALHGLLHLLGYDHHGPADRRRMARLERRLRMAGGLPVGLIERSRAPAARARRRSQARRRRPASTKK